MTTPPDYAVQTWNNDDPTTPLDAARLTHIEQGLKGASDWAATSLQLAMLAGPGPTVTGGGVATTSPAGVNEQDPKAHTHTISAGDGATAQSVNGVDVKGIPSSVVAGRMVYDATPANVTVLRLGKTGNYASDFAVVGTTDQIIPDFSVTGFGAGTGWDYDLFYVMSSTTAAQGSACLQAPSGAFDHIGWFQCVHQTMTAPNDITEFRTGPINVNQPGQQNMGGFPVSGTGYSVFRQWGSFRMPSGGGAGTMRVLTRQRVANGDTTFGLRFHSKLILAQVV